MQAEKQRIIHTTSAARAHTIKSCECECGYRCPSPPASTARDLCLYRRRVQANLRGAHGVRNAVVDGVVPAARRAGAWRGSCACARESAAAHLLQRTLRIRHPGGIREQQSQCGGSRAKITSSTSSTSSFAGASLAAAPDIWQTEQVLRSGVLVRAGDKNKTVACSRAKIEHRCAG
jgi:hypothetical protein